MKTNETQTKTSIPRQSVSNWQVIADVLVFQLKLAADGLRDLLLSPVSFVAAIAGIIAHPDEPDHYLKRLMRFGHRTDRWINLFGAYQNSKNGPATSDAYVKKLEDLVVSEYEKGGIVKSVKDGTDGLIEKLLKDKKASQATKPKPNNP